MSTKFFKIIVAVALTIGLAGQVNANLIVGDVRADDDGVNWSFVDSFILGHGPDWEDADGSCRVNGADQQTCWGDYAMPLNGIEAAKFLFGLGANEIFATSTINTSVDHLAFYDEFEGSYAVKKGEAFKADVNNDGLYSTFGDASAYINDRAGDELVNYVFKRIQDVPEPSIWAFFVLAFCAFRVRKVVC